MIEKLLRKNINIWQLSAYAIANLLGLSILLISIKFYCDSISMHTDGDTDGAIGRDYLVMSKPVPMLAAIGVNQAGTSFTEDDIENLASQPWAKRIGKFTAADFNIYASVEFAGKGLSTALFFESLPDEFVDVALDEWTFDPDNGFIPVIIPRDYLALYNFGFAASRDMPQLSEDLIKQVPLTIELSGNGHRDLFKAHIAGLSSRLNTIAVPDTFMNWANSRYGTPDRRKKSASRLIAEVDNPGNPAIKQWLNDNGVETSSDKLTAGRGSYLSKIASIVVGTIGTVISLLSIMILMLSVFLIIQKNSDKIRDLSLLGYLPSQISVYYNKIIIMINSSITILAIVVMLIASSFWETPLQAIGLSCSTPWMTIAIGIGLMIVVTASSMFAVRRLIKKTAR